MGQVPLNPGALFLFSEGRKRGQKGQNHSTSLLCYLVWFYILKFLVVFHLKKKMGFLFVSLFLKFRSY